MALILNVASTQRVLCSLQGGQKLGHSESVFYIRPKVSAIELTLPGSPTEILERVYLSNFPQ